MDKCIITNSVITGQRAFSQQFGVSGRELAPLRNTAYVGDEMA